MILGIDDQTFENYKSKYLDLYDKVNEILKSNKKHQFLMILILNWS